MGRVKKAKPLWLQLKKKMSKETLRDLRTKLTEKEIDAALRFLVGITQKVLSRSTLPAQKKDQVVFSNLVDAGTGKPVTVKVPDSLKYKDGMRAAGKAGRRAGRHIREMVRSPKPK